MTAHETGELLRRWIDAYNAHDPERFREVLTADYEEVGPSGTVSGLDAAVADADQLFTSFPDSSTEVTAQLVTDTGFAVEYRMSGTLLVEEAMPDGRVLPATGRRYDMFGCSLAWVRGDRIAVVHHYWDRALMREQLGLPASP